MGKTLSTLVLCALFVIRLGLGHVSTMRTVPGFTYATGPMVQVQYTAPHGFFVQSSALYNMELAPAWSFSLFVGYEWGR